jgi:hypothetical protein
MKHLVTIALSLIALACGSVQVFADGLTWIVQIKNDSSYNFVVRSYERNYGWSIPARTGPWSVNDLPVPWAKSESEFGYWGHHISLETAGPRCMWAIWQANWGGDEGDRVRQSRGRWNCAWAYPGDRIFNWSKTGGNRLLLIDVNANPSMEPYGGFRKHIKKPALAKRVRMRR